jgi:Ricin-type beta-trefoil lectin domain-like
VLAAATLLAASAGAGIVLAPSAAQAASSTAEVTAPAQTVAGFGASGQYGKYVRPGAVRHGVSGSPSGVQTMAFWNSGSNQLWQVHPDGSITNDESGLCLDVYGQGTSNGTDVDLYTCNGGSNQQWTLG